MGLKMMKMGDSRQQNVQTTTLLWITRDPYSSIRQFQRIHVDNTLMVVESKWIHFNVNF